MSGLRYALRDSATMLRRYLRHLRRYPAMAGMLVGMPVIFLLIFAYVFGATLGAGLGGASTGRTAYIAYVTPGIILMTVAVAATATAVSVCTDMTEGIVARFRTMAIWRPSVLAGHVAGSLIQALLAMTVVTGVAVLIGFRPSADLPQWLAAIGILALFVLAITWLSVALGLLAKTPETASNTPMPLMLLPFLGSGFVPTASMPAGLRWFAEYQPFTPVINAVRALLLARPAGDNVIAAVAWSAGIGLASYLWAKMLYKRDPVPA
jgi:ABC-2 type transport system permease protein